MRSALNCKVLEKPKNTTDKNYTIRPFTKIGKKYRRHILMWSSTPANRVFPPWKLLTEGELWWAALINYQPLTVISQAESDRL